MQQIILQMLPGLLTSLVTALAGAVAGFALGHRKTTENKDKAMESGVWKPCAITMTPMLPWVMETPLSNTSWQTVNAYRRVPPEIRRNNP